MEDAQKTASQTVDTLDDVTKFAESYASFSQVINSLQRRYLNLQDELSRQNDQLASANIRLVELTERNLAVTEFLNSLLDSVSAGVVAIDQSGVITHFNPAASRIFGIPIIKAIRCRYVDVLPVGEPESVTAINTLETGRPLASVERKLTLKNGSVCHLSVSTAVLTDKHSQPIGAVEVFQDLTPIKKLEQEVARLDTLAALGEMAATVAHQVRNPLSGIVGFASMLEQQLDEHDDRRRLVSRILEGVNNLNGTITALLEYTRLDELHRSRVVLVEFLESAIEQFKKDISLNFPGTNVNMTFASSPETIDLNAGIDRLLLRQVFFNLFANAIEMSGREATIEVSCRLLSEAVRKSAPIGQLKTSPDEAVLETTVTDHGPGIARENLEKLFTPFFTTKVNGNGLGLAVAWKIVHAHGGEILAENRPGNGAVFRVLLPVNVHASQKEKHT